MSALARLPPEPDGSDWVDPDERTVERPSPVWAFFVDWGDEEDQTGVSAPTSIVPPAILEQLRSEILGAALVFGEPPKEAIEAIGHTSEVRRIAAKAGSDCVVSLEKMFQAPLPRMLEATLPLVRGWEFEDPEPDGEIEIVEMDIEPDAEE